MHIYNIAIIGCGMISKSHLAAIKSMDNARCAAVCDIVESKARSAGESAGCRWFTDAETMLKTVGGIDVCLLALPTYLHPEFVELCAAFGKAVLCEKPLAMTRDGTLRVKRALEKYKVPFMTAQVVRFWTGYREIKQMMDAGEFGDIYLSYFSRCSERQVWDNHWLFDPKKGGGAMYDMMVHDIDYMNYLFGPSKSVYTLASRDETGCYNNVFANITYLSGAKGVAETAFNMHTGFPFSMYAKIMGSKAACELVYQAGFDINQRNGATAVLKIFREGHSPENLELRQYDAYREETAYFLSCIDQHRAPEIVTLDQTINVISTANAIEASANNGCVVNVEQ